MQNFCRMCGAKIPKNAGFCPDCGAKVEKSVEQEDFRKIETQGYVEENDQKSQVYSSYNHNPPQNFNNNYDVANTNTDVDKVAAGLLGIFLGGLGVHKFYMGDTGAGIAYLIFCWTGIPAIIGLIEGIIYLCESDSDFQRRVKS